MIPSVEFANGLTISLGVSENIQTCLMLNIKIVVALLTTSILLRHGREVMKYVRSVRELDTKQTQNYFDNNEYKSYFLFTLLPSSASLINLKTCFSSAAVMECVPRLWINRNSCKVLRMCNFLWLSNAEMTCDSKPRWQQMALLWDQITSVIILFRNEMSDFFQYELLPLKRRGAQFVNLSRCMGLQLVILDVRKPIQKMSERFNVPHYEYVYVFSITIFFLITSHGQQT